MPRNEIKISPKEQQILRDDAHRLLSGVGDISIAIGRGDYREAYEDSLLMREAMACLDVIGWGYEEPHEILIVAGTDDAAAVAKVAERIRAATSEELADADVAGLEDRIRHCDEVLGRVRG